MTIEFHRRTGSGIVAIAGGRGGAGATTEGRRDKKPHIAARSGGCFDWLFRERAHIADFQREARIWELSNDFCESCTSQPERP